MDKLTKYLIDYAEELIGTPIRPSEEVLQREDSALYIWRKMCMSHETLKKYDPTNKSGWKSIAPAAHLYALSREELNNIKKYLNRFYMELKEAMGGDVGESLWYITRSSPNEWVLYSGLDSFGAVTEVSEELEYAPNVENALTNFIYHMVNDFDGMTELTTSIVFPFGCNDESVWQYAGMVSMLGEKESNDFVEKVVRYSLVGKETCKISAIV